MYESFIVDEEDGGAAMSKAALHVIIMDEFDAMARARGGKGGSGDQGDAGVARDSVVNQLLAKMDGVDPLPVPTLVIGMTNKRSLIEPALLRPGRFEVQIEVPPPKTKEQRIEILRVHTKSMLEAGRLLVADAPTGSPAARYAERGDGSDKNDKEKIPMYEDLLDSLAEKCEGMSGASLAGVARAAASHALERSVCDFSERTSSLAISTDSGSSSSDNGSMSLSLECVVTSDDLGLAVQDVIASSGETDFAEDEATEETLESQSDGRNEGDEDDIDNTNEDKR